MSEEHVKIVLTAEDRASAEIEKLQRALNRLKRSFGSFSVNPIKGQFGADMVGKVREDLAKTQSSVTRGLDRQMVFQTRMNRQRLQEERAVTAEQARQDRARRIGEDRAMRDLRQRTAAETRSLREQAGMERDAERARTAGMRETIRLDNYRFGLRQRYERETAREQAATARETVRLDNYRFGLRQRHERDVARERTRAERQGAAETRASDRRRADVRRSVGRGFTDARDVSGRIVDASRTVSILGSVGAGAIASLGSIGLAARSRADTAEANLRMFGGQSRSQVDATRSGWLNRSAVEFGFRPHDALNSFTEVLKAGIPEIAAKDVTRSIMGASAGLDLDVPETTKLVGRLSTLTQDPKAFSAGAIDKMLNGIAVVAKVAAADSKELVSSLRRGAGALGASKMSITDLTAFTGTGISAGMQEGKAGTFMDFLVNELVNAKNSRGQRRDDLTKGFNLLGLGSNTSVSRQAANDPTKLLLSMFDKMSKMSPEKAGQVASLIGMREWRGEILQMMKANPMLRQTVEAARDPKNSGHLKQASDEKLGTLAGLHSQLVATFDLAWEAVGGGIEDIIREISTFFINLGKGMDFDVIKAHVHTLIDGFVDGLGFKNITEMLEAAFGKPGQMDFSTLKSFFEFAQGFGRGVRQVIDTIKSVVSSFTGTNMNADALGNLSAKVLGFSLALAFIAPYVSILAGLGTALIGFGMTVGTIATALRAAGLMGGAGAAGAGAAGAGTGAAAGGFMARLLGALRLAPAIAAPLTMDPSKADNDRLMNRLGRWAQDREKERNEHQSGTVWKDPPARVQKQSLDVETTGSIADLVKKASYTGYDDREDSTRRVASGIDELRAILQKATLTNGGSGASIASSMGGGVGGGSGGGGGGSSRLFTPPNMQVPNWYGQSKGAPGGMGAGGGSASSNPANSSASATMLDAIAGTESGKAGYDTVLGNGKYGMPNKPVSSMSLDEAFAFGRTVKARHGSSSALGRYQIVGNTMRLAQRALGIGGDAKFDGAMQDRMARWIARSQGLGAWEGLKGNPRAMATARAAMEAGGAKDAPLGTLASTDPNIGVNVPGLGLGKGQYDGLRVKGDQATGNGFAQLGVTDLARQAQANLPGGVKHFSAFNDRYHAETGSKHALGLAFDTSLNDAGLSTQAAEAMRNKMRAAGLSEKDFKVIDEYKSPSARSTGGHIHSQFNTLDAAKKYHDYIAGLEGESKRAVASVNGIGERAAKAQNGGTERLQPPKGGKVDIGGGMSGVPLGAKPTTADIVGNVPAGLSRGGGGGMGGGGGNTYRITQQIHGGDKSPGEIANLAQRKITEDWNHRGHDLEPELT